MFLVIHTLTEQRNSTAISVTATTTHMATITAGPLLMFPSDGASVESILRFLLSSFSLDVAAVHASPIVIDNRETRIMECGALFIS